MKLKKLAFALLVLFSGQQLIAQNIQDFFSKTDSFLKTYVSQGKVDYKAISANPSSLEETLGLAASTSLDGLDATTTKAFWINAYNLAVIKGIIDNYPIKSPLDKAGFFDKDTYAFAGTAITLNDIENKKIRPVYKDARIHFVLVCGAIGCPPIINQAYLPATLDAQLLTQTRKALNNPSFIQESGKRVLVSEIFKWYMQDFGSNNSQVLDYINSFREIPLSGSKLGYYSYNWSLNIQ